jgi:hypothetical protein
MQQQHLNPEDIDILLDGEEAFGVSAPTALQAHVAACATCRAEVDGARTIAELLERLPDTVPSPGFANRVMAQVQVFEPWHVTALDALRRIFPARGPVRTLAGAGAGGVGFAISGLAIWAALRFDQASYAGQLALTRVESVATATVGSAVSGLFGDAALSSFQSGGMPAVAVGVVTVLFAFAAATIGLRGLFAGARRRER